ncbi:DUF3929 family protein [Bacillus sp. HC-Mk]
MPHHIFLISIACEDIVKVELDYITES